ncbi:CoA transferase [Mycobacterium kubicae]|uniref:CoA transferase n=1 Tax=Mycobacterium kubicae TaxID=120959 RepID=A0AAX1JDE4_9MYCO|nr:CoA transferase [Mycobacterium kubicae]MCV7097858.1 CoA transferase [Mycobacterium kubicae]ORW06036.1 acyl-CoA transferase [Mycobacterium kubicae]QNI10254.1 CoA transferase [Mycobacterium kubicae]QPI38459.1 CoA transferase [Mycobacterium kubicae]GFG63743.1 CoA transferase [Mycobacterium kubicae]
MGGVGSVPSPQGSQWTSAWGSSGLAYLTGRADGPPDFSRAPVLGRAEQIAADIAGRTGITLEASALLTGRAGLLGLTRAGRTSAGGATRLMSARDGWCAITLSRPDDIAAVPALLHADEVPEDPWPAVQRWAGARSVSEISERAALLDLPAAVLGEATAAPPQTRRLWPPAARRELAGLVVADLSSMWAGPLCGQVLAMAGATVIKVESPTRPDGTRAGDPAFFDWINGHKLSYCVDFDRDAEQVRALLTIADIVIEGSRPDALARRRLGPDQVAPRPGRIWLRLNGYGANCRRPAFGDDAAVAGGLVGVGPVFCADAVADPLAGLEAAAAVLGSLHRGGGELINVSMAAVAASYAALPTDPPVSPHPAPPPAAPRPARAAAPLGADNEAVHRLVGQSHCLP